MAAYRRVYDSRHLQADCQDPGSAREPYANRVWATFTFLIVGLSGGNNITIADHTRSFDFFPIPIRFLCHNCFYLRQFLFPLQLLFWTRDAMLAQH